MKLKIGTFNILNTSCRYEERKIELKRTLSELKCDIIGLQELNFQINPELFDLSTYTIKFVALPNPMLKSEPEFRIDGNGVLIKNDIEILEEHRLVYKNNLRVAQILKLQKQNQAFIFVNTHLDHLSESIREQQLRELMQALKPYYDYPIICTGDYNFLPEVNNYKLMSKEFISAYFQIHDKEPMITFPTGLYGPYADIESYGCFDYIWIRGAKAISAEVYRDCGNQQIWASDHYPVYGEIEFI
ncbi:hypothetical protein SteCoe_5063 [Stentor coeruleus]|uniref:Endonuclease/exonuclease/phosphatase domain-containing protein n=1 Tax=Stentor coeruleus TaxID=5963 RepID=A0A1R2CT76_9CILI|nr:hypothetical protein SteCoe_5063 [Stentor coeruleus]